MAPSGVLRVPRALCLAGGGDLWLFPASPTHIPFPACSAVQCSLYLLPPLLGREILEWGLRNSSVVVYSGTKFGSLWGPPACGGCFGVGGEAGNALFPFIPREELYSLAEMLQQQPEAPLVDISLSPSSQQLLAWLPSSVLMEQPSHLQREGMLQNPTLQPSKAWALLFVLLLRGTNSPGEFCLLFWAPVGK